MIRQDFIKRAIEQLGEAIAALVGKQRPPSEVLAQVANAKRGLPLVPGLIEQLTAEQIAERLPDPALLDSLARLFQVQAEAYKDLGRTAEALHTLKKGLALFEHSEVLKVASEATVAMDGDR